ncbi:MAG: sacsin N-terminal ATP-binding-like domain-containing protein, partial [Anaerolineae bacterium]
MSLPLSAQEFAAMPLEGQLSALRAVLPSAEPGALLELCAGLRDHAPLSWLCAQLALRGWLRGEAERQWFARFLVGLSGTAVDKVLRALRDEVRRGGIQATEDLAATLIAALRVVPISRLPALCLIDRALKHTFPDVRDRHVEAQVRGCRAAIDAGRVDELDVARLAQLPSRAVVTLRERARSGPAGALEAFDALRAELARKAIEVLGNAPKAISQANAEELLSRRVYTDPGHFLIELLQNAEDAGATTWRLTFDARRIVVWHDGLPFNAMDVVGVCSIGQTTKRRQQIGFFGVGFKSVYEVSDRPRIYSDVYRFEIADVSIPKALSSWPSDLPQDGTVVVLPLRDP